MSFLPAIDNTVRLTVYRVIVESGRFLDLTEISRIANLTPSEVESSLYRLADNHVLVLDDGPAIRMAMPFSAVPTDFRVSTAHGNWFANCAWDALGIPAVLHEDASLSASCADCGSPIEIRVSDGRTTLIPIFVHFAVPAARWWDDIRYT